MLAVMVVLLFIQVFSRYALSDPPDWTEELARAVFIYLTFVGGALAIVRNAHLKIQTLHERLSPGTRPASLDVALILIGVVFLAVVVFHSITPAGQLAHQPMTSVPDLESIRVRRRADRLRAHARLRGDAAGRLGSRAARHRRKFRRERERTVEDGRSDNVLALMFLVFVVLLVLGLDLWYAMGVASLLYLVMLSFGAMPIPLTLIPQQLMAGVDSFPLLAIPMFILAGELMTRGGVTLRLVHFSSVLVGHIKGGLAQVSIVANVIMAGMSGSAAADLAATGSLLIPGMVKRKYPADFASAVIASASTIGPVIPPSIPMVIIGSMVSVSVGQLFMGGVVPGLLMGLAMMVVVYRFAKTHESAGRAACEVARVHALALGRSACARHARDRAGLDHRGHRDTDRSRGRRRRLRADPRPVRLPRDQVRQLPEIFANVAVTSAAVMVTVGAAQLFGWITAAEGLGNDIGRWLTALSTNPYVILLVINIVLLILGMFMEPVPIMLLTVPILFPVVTKLGIDPVHFGVVVTLNLMIGCLTPPVGLNLFLASAISGVPVMRVARAATPFIVVLLIVLALITYIPQLVLWLPQLIAGGALSTA